MKIFSKVSLIILGVAFTIVLARPSDVSAATSPTLSALTDYSVLAGDTVTCTGATTITGDVGVSPGTAITGFPSTAGPCTVGPPGTEHSNDASAIAAQAENLVTFGTLDQPCDQSYPSGQDLTLISPLVPGVYCSDGSFLLTGNLNLTGSGVWIFKTVSTLVTSPGSSVTGGDPCNVWWRIGSSTTLDTTTSFIGTIISQTGANAMNTGATLDGRFLALAAAAVSLDDNTISGPTCADSGDSGGSDDDSGDSGGSGSGDTTPGLPDTGIAPENKSHTPWNIILPAGIAAIALSSYLVRKKRVI